MILFNEVDLLVYENWARFADNGIWNYPRAWGLPEFVKKCRPCDWRAKLIDDVIYFNPKWACYGMTYKIRLEDYSEESQELIIDSFLPILV